MTHLIVCREYPPAPYPPGGIGAYAKHIGRLLAEAGETVHLIAQRWEGAPARVSEQCGGKLIIHRVSVDGPLDAAGAGVLRSMAESDCPSQAFSWQAALLAESLVEEEPVDVIEAQEWEAPLYCFQVRRALGLGPRRQPPCLVHIHSPSRLIFRHNEWDTKLADFGPVDRREEYSIRAADALICPSRYLALEAEPLFSLAPGAVQVLPYPAGDTPVLERPERTWARDCILYAGRLELRKGIVEWVDAAVQVARSHPTVTFEFIGSDTSLTGAVGPAVREYLNQRIPRSLRSRFRFRGSRRRDDLLRALAEVAVAVVPSRWDNLPYTCIEAMSSGLPVLISPNGGMAELVTDGRSGWVAPDGSASGLARALRSVLDTPPAKRAAMGAEAARAVRRICSNESVLQRRVDLHTRLAHAGASRSLQIPLRANACEGAAPERCGTGIVLTCDDPKLLPPCVAAICGQTEPAKRVVVVARECHRNAAELAACGEINRWSVLFTSDVRSGGARILALQSLLSAEPNLRDVAFLTESARIAPDYVRVCESIFASQPGAGALSSWIRYGERIDVGPREHAFAPAIAVRFEALGDGETLSGTGGSWAAITYPEVLVTAHPSSLGTGREVPKRYSVMALAQRSSPAFALKSFMTAPLKQKAGWLARALVQPRGIARSVLWLARRTARNIWSPGGEHAR